MSNKISKTEFREFRKLEWFEQISKMDEMTLEEQKDILRHYKNMIKDHYRAQMRKGLNRTQADFDNLNVPRPENKSIEDHNIDLLDHYIDITQSASYTDEGLKDIIHAAHERMGHIVNYDKTDPEQKSQMDRAQDYVNSVMERARKARVPYPSFYELKKKIYVRASSSKSEDQIIEETLKALEYEADAKDLRPKSIFGF